MNKDSANQILTQRVCAPLTVILAQYDGPLVLEKHVDRLDVDIDYVRFYV